MEFNRILHEFEEFPLPLFSCQTCRALVLDYDQDGHKAWHDEINREQLLGQLGRG